MSRVEVEPGALRTPAADCDRVARLLVEVRRTLVAEGVPDTGDGPGTASLGAVLHELAASLDRLSQLAAGDALALLGAGASYADAERRVVDGASR